MRGLVLLLEEKTQHVLYPVATMQGHSEKAASASQEENSHQNPTILASISWTSQPTELQEIDFCF